MLSKSDFAVLVPIRDMDRALKFYTKALGGRLQMRAEGEMKDFWASVKINRQDFWLVNSPGRRPKIPELAFNAFVVKDIERTVEGLKRNGVRFEKAERSEMTRKVEGPIAYEDFGASAFFKDTEGNLLMLWQGAS